APRTGPRPRPRRRAASTACAGCAGRRARGGSTRAGYRAASWGASYPKSGPFARFGLVPERVHLRERGVIGGSPGGAEAGLDVAEPPRELAERPPQRVLRHDADEPRVVDEREEHVAELVLQRLRLGAGL